MGGDSGDRAEGGHQPPPPPMLSLPTDPPRAPRCSGRGLEPAAHRHVVSSAQPHSSRRWGLLGKGSPPLHRVTRRRGHFQDLPVRLGPCTTTSAISGPSRFLRVLPPRAGGAQGAAGLGPFCHFGAVTARSQQGFGAPGSIPRHQAPHRMGAGCQHQLQSL